MRDLRLDPTTGDLVILSTDRVRRPRHLEPGRMADPGPEGCPFCPGNEVHTPPALATVGDAVAWTTRVFPNKFPAVGIEGAVERRAHGPYARSAGIGAHEVIVETREHAIPVWQNPSGTADALRIVRERMRDLARDRRFRSLMWFRNVGAEAGATLAHPHAQLVALAEVPPMLARVRDRCARYLVEHDRELFTDLLHFDVDEGRRVLLETDALVAVCPWAPRAPFEVWLVPTRPGASFLDADDDTIGTVAAAMCRVLGAQAAALETPSYNAVLYTAPLHGDSSGFRWHFRLMPRFSAFAGFELGSGAVMHGTPPEEAMTVLRAHLQPAVSAGGARPGA